MKAGALDRSVTILRQGAPVDDGFQTLPGAWGTLAVRKAQRITSRGREVFENQGIDALVPMTFVFRDDSVTRNIVPTDKLLYGLKGYDIKSVNEIGRRRGVEVVAVANADEIETDATLLSEAPTGIEW